MNDLCCVPFDVDSGLDVHILLLDMDDQSTGQARECYWQHIPAAAAVKRSP